MTEGVESMAAGPRAIRTCILVTGMHRSGTSATAGALGLCGVALGGDLLAPGDDNPKGYFEHGRAVAINERLLSSLGSSWADARALPAGWSGSDAAREAVEAIGALLDTEFADAPVFALKDPRLCRVMPVWLEALRRRGVRAASLFVAREPAEVAASLQARNGWAPAMGEALWLRYTADAEAATRDIPRAGLSYQALLEDPARTLGIALGRIGISLPTPSTDGLARFVDAGQRHQRANVGGDPATRHLFSAPVAEARDALAAIAGGGDAWSRLAAAGDSFDRAWAQAGGTLDAFAMLATRVVGQQADIKAQLAWAEQAVAKQEALHAEVAHASSALQAQLAWSEAAVREREALQAEVAQLSSDLTAQVRWSEQAVADWAERADRYERTLAQRGSELAEREAELAAIRRSVAWRISTPLRAIEAFAKRSIKRISGKHEPR